VITSVQRVAVTEWVDLFPERPYTAGAGWSSLVARRAHNPEVEGSNPSPANGLYIWGHDSELKLAAYKEPAAGLFSNLAEIVVKAPKF
jgi:hypothetical protein